MPSLQLALGIRLVYDIQGSSELKVSAWISRRKVERGGNVVARVSFAFIKDKVELGGSLLLRDEQGYNAVRSSIEHPMSKGILEPVFVWKYNQRRNENAFGTFINGCFA